MLATKLKDVDVSRTSPPHVMPCPLRLGDALDACVFSAIKREMALTHFKWDPQVGDVSTLAPFALLLSASAWKEVAALAEALAAETVAMESALLERTDLHRYIALPRALRQVFSRGAPWTPAAARIMRFDFHWTTEGWRISETNSDVPGGYTEASSFTRLFADHVLRARPAGDPARAVVDAIARTREGSGPVALVSAPGHMEDHQVVLFLAERLRKSSIPSEVVAPSHLFWEDGHARIENAWTSVRASAIFRFHQAEWLPRLPRAVPWRPMFSGARTPVANPGTAVLTESKRLPLVWDRLGVAIPTWRRLLPETRALSEAPWDRDDEWLIKAAYGNTGDTVAIRSAMSTSSWRRRAWGARLFPRAWIAQRRFEIVPLTHSREPEAVRPCVGVYTVNGIAAGAYGRLATGAVIDGYARDVAVLVEETPRGSA